MSDERNIIVFSGYIMTAQQYGKYNINKNRPENSHFPYLRLNLGINRFCRVKSMETERKPINDKKVLNK